MPITDSSDGTCSGKITRLPGQAYYEVTFDDDPDEVQIVEPRQIEVTSQTYEDRDRAPKGADVVRVIGCENLAVMGLSRGANDLRRSEGSSAGRSRDSVQVALLQHQKRHLEHRCRVSDRTPTLPRSSTRLTPPSTDYM